MKILANDDMTIKIEMTPEEVEQLREMYAVYYKRIVKMNDFFNDPNISDDKKEQHGGTRMNALMALNYLKVITDLASINLGLEKHQ